MTRRALAVDAHLGAGEVAAEAVRVADRHDPDPRVALGDEAAAVARRLARRAAAAQCDLARPREHRLEPVVGGSSPNGERP